MVRSWSSHWPRWLAAVPCLLLLLLGTATSTTTTVRQRRLGGDETNCEKKCEDAKFKDYQYFGDSVNLLDPAVMLKRLQEQRKQWVDTKLKKDYGDQYYMDMFEPLEQVLDYSKNETVQQRVSVGRHRIFRDAHLLHTKDTSVDTGNQTGWTKLVRKMQIKLLQVQLGLLEERQNAKPICVDDCTKQQQANQEGNSRRRQRRHLAKTPKVSNGLYAKFTWATGGHSASAGHGNMFRESYTANMDRALTPLLASIGLDFEARNYAMGGTDSAEEVALCYNSIFGKDIDAASWDYGMTDGHDVWKVTMYAYKAAGLSNLKDSRSQPGNIPYRPAFFPIHQQGGVTMIAKHLQDLGMTTLAYDNDYMQNTILAAVPDMFGKKEDDINKTPLYIQYLKCEGKIESGDPNCGNKKFNDTICNNRKARTSWHPGWKYHALMGNLMAMTLLDALEDALTELIDMKLVDVTTAGKDLEAAKKQVSNKLKDLDQQEGKDYERIFSEPFPDEVNKNLDRWWAGSLKDHLTDLDMEAFFKKQSFCHSALLPSEIRFKGLLTERFDTVGTIMDQSYDTGVSWWNITNVESPNQRSGKDPAPYNDTEHPEKNGEMRLIKDDSGRQDCPEFLNLDYKDWFHAGSVADWQTLVLPNDSEKKYYTEFDAKNSKGYIVACLTRCDWGKCSGGDLHDYFGWQRPGPHKGQDPPPPPKAKVEMKINGVDVTEASDMHTCFALKNNNGHVWKPNENGQYTITTRVTGAESYSYIRISAFVLL